LPVINGTWRIRLNRTQKWSFGGQFFEEAIQHCQLRRKLRTRRDAVALRYTELSQTDSRAFGGVASGAAAFTFLAKVMYRMPNERRNLEKTALLRGAIIG
jgi:hypothetical protein